jgi:hypothetical protein
MATYCVINHNGDATIIPSNTERGAKSFATRNDYSQIGRVSPYSWAVYDIQTKRGTKWHKEGITV